MISNVYKLDQKRIELANKLSEMLDDRYLNVLETEVGKIEKLVINECITLHFNGSGDLFSEVDEDGEFYYAGGDFSCQVFNPTEVEVGYLINSWKGILKAFEQFDVNLKNILDN